MGQLLQGHTPLSTSNPKHKPIQLEQYSTIFQTDRGNIVSRLSDDASFFISHREVQSSSFGSIKSKEINEWLSQTYAYSCNVVQYQVRSRSMLCSDQLTLKLLLQYGKGTLHDFLSKDKGNAGTIMENSDVSYGSEAIRFQTPLQRMHFIRTLLDIAEEQLSRNKLWVCFHTKNLVYFPKDKTFKLFHILNFDDSTYHESFFAPEEAGLAPTQQSCIFSMGVILMSLFLGEDCSDCYNYQNFTFCQSIFEDRVQRLKEGMIARGLMGILDDQSRYIPHFDEEISELILLMTAVKEERLCFAQVKRRYLWLIRKASMSYAPSSIQHHNTNTRSILEPLTSKRAARGRKMKAKQHPNIGCFSTNEEIHFRTTITEGDESCFLNLSKSIVQAKGKNKKKDSQVLQWKKKITNRMKQQHKENIPFLQGQQ